MVSRRSPRDGAETWVEPDGSEVPTPSVPTGSPATDLLLARASGEEVVAGASLPDPVLGWLTQDEGAIAPRWTVEGSLVRSRIVDWMRTASASFLLGDELHTSVLTPWHVGSTGHEVASRFADRVFLTSKDRERALRWNSDAGVLEHLAHDGADASVRRLWEVGVGFRQNQSGERRGIRRLDEFTLHDHHTLVGDVDRALLEHERQLSVQIALASCWTDSVAIEVEADVRHWDRALRIARHAAAKANVPVGLRPKRSPDSYWAVRHVLSMHDLHRTFNTQLDLELPKRLRVEVGAEAPPVLLHTSFGTIERMLLVAAGDRAPTPRALPTWLASTQVSIVPTSEAIDVGPVVAAIARAGIRHELHDGSRPVGPQLRQSVARRIPRRLVVGEEELRTDRYRTGADGWSGSLAEFIALVLRADDWRSSTRVRLDG